MNNKRAPDVTRMTSLWGESNKRHPIISSNEVTAQTIAAATSGGSQLKPAHRPRIVSEGLIIFATAETRKNKPTIPSVHRVVLHALLRCDKVDIIAYSGGSVGC